MDDAVIRAMAKWPDVPDVFGWLRLDRRGNWRIRGETDGDPVFEPIGNAGFIEFIGRNYAPDAQGRWYFQNGPQRVFVQLAFAPFVFTLDEGGRFVDQCGQIASPLEGAWLDEEGSLVLRAGGRTGLLDDRDLARIADAVSAGSLQHCKDVIVVGRVASTDLERRFGFRRDPKP